MIVETPSFAGLAGVARRDITPPPGIRARNWGPATWDVAAGVHRPLTLSALALAAAGEEGAPAAGERPLVLIEADLGWWRGVDSEWALRSALLEALDLPPERLLFALSHTHAGPSTDLGDADLDGGGEIAGYRGRLLAAATEAAREAIGALRPATIEWATGRCALAAERELLREGRALVGFNPAGAADDTLLIGRIAAADERRTPLGTLVNYACHPTTLAWQCRLISPDWPGAMRATVEAATGAPCLFLQGASGDLAPREQYVGDVEVADRHGRAVAHAVLAALETLPPPGSALELSGVQESGAPLALWEAVPHAGSRALAAERREVELAFRELPTLAQLAAEWAGIDPQSRDERLRRARALRDGYVEGPTVRHPIWLWRIGDALLAAHPGEAFQWLQRTLRAELPERPLLVANLVNGPGFVYLPTQAAYDRGAYAAWQTPLAAGSLERLHAAMKEGLEAVGNVEKEIAR
ncbi:hypothetical protein [Conexibacter arvalis]|uniref:Alkaline ceramidase n=1 Tax=Conexibacter arvalis TaxID=912552 RepID=A0A840I7R1_9ACTN|nr:hypothetical protein [Conexibacter arvalis]MBB4660929.1 hypothetical protein [Conexibacter arvalis]